MSHNRIAVYFRGKRQAHLWRSKCDIIQTVNALARQCHTTPRFEEMELVIVWRPDPKKPDDN